MDVAEIPSDVSSIEAFEANPIPAAREAVEEPAPRTRVPAASATSAAEHPEQPTARYGQRRRPQVPPLSA